MKKLFIVLLFGCIGYSQTLPKGLSSMDDTEKMMYYMTEKKVPALGVMFELLLPTSGYAYSGNFQRGITKVGAALLPVLIGGLIYNDGILAEKCAHSYDDDCEPKDGDYYRDDKDKMAIGYAIAVYGYAIVEIMNLFDVARNVKIYNYRLFKKNI